VHERHKNREASKERRCRAGQLKNLELARNIAVETRRGHVEKKKGHNIKLPTKKDVIVKRTEQASVEDVIPAGLIEIWMLTKRPRGGVLLVQNFEVSLSRVGGFTQRKRTDERGNTALSGRG